MSAYDKIKILHTTHVLEESVVHTMTIGFLGINKTLCSITPTQNMAIRGRYIEEHPITFNTKSSERFELSKQYSNQHVRYMRISKLVRMLTFSLVDTISSRIVFFCSGVDIHENPLAFSLHSSFSFSLSEPHISLNTGILERPSAGHNTITFTAVYDYILGGGGGGGEARKQNLMRLKKTTEPDQKSDSNKHITAIPHSHVYMHVRGCLYLRIV